MTVTVIATSLFLLLQTGKGSIEGIVVNSITNEPITGAQVTATRMPAPPPQTAGSQAPNGIVGVVAGGAIGTPAGTLVAVAPPPNGAPLQQPVQLAPARTNASGQFSFHDLEPGTYSLRASAEGYAQQEYNPRPGVSTGMTASINLAADQISKGTVFRLTPGGTVSGRVTGSRGEPLVNIEVSLLRNAYDPDGRKTLQQRAQAQTNDRGEYRMFWVTPGRYYLSAVSSNRPIPGVPFNPTSFSNKYPRTFYAVAPDVDSAVPIEVQPAVELSGLDFRLTEQPTYRIRGRVVDPTSGSIPTRPVSISIVPRGSVLNTGISFSGSPYNPADGTFELRDVPAGAYLIRGQLPVNSRPEPGQPFSPPPIATAPVDVAGADVDGVVLTFVPPTSIGGRMRIEGETLPQNFRASINLRPAVLGGIGPAPRPAQANAEGIFNIDGVVPGEYRVTANFQFGSSQMNLYVKEIRFGSTDVLTNMMVVTGPTSDKVEVLFGKNGGQISGTVRGDSQQLISGAQVVLVPDNRDRHDLYKFAITGANGQFTFLSVAPGSYKVFAWENIEQFSWFDAIVLARHESQGMPATVNDSSNVTLELKVIPAAVGR
jgi:protocatechuate 3,4-dioxygenase beta subunit